MIKNYVFYCDIIKESDNNNEFMFIIILLNNKLK